MSDFTQKVAQRVHDLQVENADLKHKLECALEYIHQSPCDPDIYPEQLKAYNALVATGAMKGKL